MGAVLIEGVETSLDANLQLEKANDDQEGLKPKPEGNLGLTDKSGTVLPQDDCHQPNSDNRSLIPRTEKNKKILSVESGAVGEISGSGLSTHHDTGAGMGSFQNQDVDERGMGMEKEQSSNEIGEASKGDDTTKKVTGNVEEVNTRRIVGETTSATHMNDASISATSCSATSCYGIQCGNHKTDEDRTSSQKEVSLSGTNHLSSNNDKTLTYDGNGVIEDFSVGKKNVSLSCQESVQGTTSSLSPEKPEYHMTGHVTSPERISHVSSNQEDPLSSQLDSDGMKEAPPLPSSNKEVWFSILPHELCETSPVIYSSKKSASLTNQQMAVVPSGSTSQLLTQQQATSATPTPQYLYVTADGQVLGSAPPQVVQQVMDGGSNVSYALVGNTLVPVGEQSQFVAVNSGAPQQAGVQYVIAQQDQQGGVQYLTVGRGGGGGGAAAGTGNTSKGDSTEVWQSFQQPQYVTVTDGTGQQQLMQVVTGEGGGQLLVQVSPEQIQNGTGTTQHGNQVVVRQGQAGQVVLTAPQANPVIVGQGQTGPVVLAAPQGNQVILGQNQSGQVVLGQNQSGQVVLGQNQSGQVVLGQNQSGQVVLGQNQSGQVVLGQNPSGQVVLAAPQASNQVVIGQRQTGQIVVAAPQGNQVVIGQGQSPQVVLATTPQQVASQGQSEQVVLTALPQQANQSATAQGQGTSVVTSTVVPAEKNSQDIIRGGQLVQIAEQDQYGILSNDGTKLILADSKEAAIATLQAASASSSNTSTVLQAQQSPRQSPTLHPKSSSPALASPPKSSSSVQYSALSQSSLGEPSHSEHTTVAHTSPVQQSYISSSNSPIPSLLAHSSQLSQSSKSLKKEPSLPNTGRYVTATPPISGKATLPATVGQSTEAMETTDSSRPPANQEVSLYSWC